MWLLLVVTNISLAQDGGREYPMGPNARLTPGELCDRPARYRYPENIAYCERDVSTQQKDQVFAAYRSNGFKLSYQNRSSYKVDHYLPLCAGGSNNNENLWPQHLSISNITDALEKLGCDKMALGKITQAKFITLIKRVKNDLSQANAVRAELSRL
ncbi:MAG: hypothetical protein H0V66_07730 [Bdellovibrionales bacterium]|nr:hypothetical protein [Bdellovibrionales bacterium]